jgi:phosphoglycerol geranylgeranyltransferase
MTVADYLRKRIEEDGGCCLILIDPFEQSPEAGGDLAKAAEAAGADAILIGGSIGAHGEYLDATARHIREAVDLPTIIFPSNVGAISRYVDAIYFMYMINSTNPYYITGAQIQGAPVIKKYGIEAIPTAYVVLEPGKTVGWVGNANPVPRDNPDVAAACALAGEYMGAQFVITDSGSGAPSPAPLEIVRAIKSVLTIPYINAGGIKTPEQAYESVRAGADAVQIGTAIEKMASIEEAEARMKKLVEAVKKAGKEKR